MTTTTYEFAEFTATVSGWDKNLIEQAIEIFGDGGAPFSMNTFRDLLPDMAHGTAGTVLRSMSLRKPAPIREIAKVKSTSGPTHGKDIGLYVLTPFGQQQAARRRQERQGRAA